MLGDNVGVTADQIGQIRSLSDFDLAMFLSEIEDHGWKAAVKLLLLIQKAVKASRQMSADGRQPQFSEADLEEICADLARHR